MATQDRWRGKLRLLPHTGQTAARNIQERKST